MYVYIYIYVYIHIDVCTYKHNDAYIYMCIGTPCIDHAYKGMPQYCGKGTVKALTLEELWKQFSLKRVV